jgi:hypothetical protein
MFVRIAVDDGVVFRNVLKIRHDDRTDIHLIFRKIDCQIKKSNSQSPFDDSETFGFFASTHGNQSFVMMQSANFVFADYFRVLVGVPGIEPGLHPPHGRVLPVYYTP